MSGAGGWPAEEARGRPRVWRPAVELSAVEQGVVRRIRRARLFVWLRERVAVEHSLTRLGRWQGRRARYRGRRKNLLDPRRAAVVHNLHVLARLAQATPIASEAA